MEGFKTNKVPYKKGMNEEGVTEGDKSRISLCYYQMQGVRHSVAKTEVER